MRTTVQTTILLSTRRAEVPPQGPPTGAPVRYGPARVESSFPGCAEPRPQPGGSQPLERTIWDDWSAPAQRRLLWAEHAARCLSEFAYQLTVPLAQVARTFVDQRMWTVFCCARAEEHCKERYDRTAHWLRNLATLGRGLDTLPGLERALTGEDGEAPLGRTAAVELSKVAIPESAAEWIRLGRSLSHRELKDAVREARRAKSAWPVQPSATPGDRSEADESRGRLSSDRLDPTADVQADGPRSQVSMLLPPALRVAFDEVLELHRAVSGRNTTVSDFVEALVAESMTGPAPADVEPRPLNPARPVDGIERELARANGNWKWLDETAVPVAPQRGPRDRRFERLYRKITRLLGRLEVATTWTGAGTPAELNRQIRELLRLENCIGRPLGELLAYMRDKHGWSKLGFDGVGHYAAERLSMSRRTAQARSYVASALRHFPLLRKAYESDRLGLEPVLLLLRVLGSRPVSPELERAWLERALEFSLKRLRDEVRVADRDWILHGGSQVGEPLSDDAWQRSQALFSGTIRRRFARLAELAEPIPTVTELRLRLAEPLANDFLGAIEDRRLQLTQTAKALSVDDSVSDSETDQGRRAKAPLTAKAACRLSARGAYEADSRAPASEMPLSLGAATLHVSRGLDPPSWIGLMALLEEYVATWDAADARPARGREVIHGRDGMRCAAPLCTSRRNLEAHHLHYRSQQGSDDPDNLISLCRFHHQRGEHGSLASCSGKAPLGVKWRLGHDDVAEWYRNERKLPSPVPLAEDS